MPRMADPSQPNGGATLSGESYPPSVPPTNSISGERCAQCQAAGVTLLAPDEPVGMTPSPGSLNKPRYVVDNSAWKHNRTEQGDHDALGSLFFLPLLLL